MKSVNYILGNNRPYSANSLDLIGSLKALLVALYSQDFHLFPGRYLCSQIHFSNLPFSPKWICDVRGGDRHWKVKQFLKGGHYHVQNLCLQPFRPTPVPVLAARSCLTLHGAVYCSLPGPSVHAVLPYWSGLSFLSPGNLPDPGTDPGSPALQADFLPSELPGKPICFTTLLSHTSF